MPTSPPCSPNTATPARCSDPGARRFRPRPRRTLWGGEWLSKEGQRLGRLAPMWLPAAMPRHARPWRMSGPGAARAGRTADIPARLPQPAARTVAAMLASWPAPPADQQLRPVVRSPPPACSASVQAVNTYEGGGRDPPRSRRLPSRARSKPSPGAGDLRGWHARPVAAAREPRRRNGPGRGAARFHRDVCMPRRWPLTACVWPPGTGSIPSRSPAALRTCCWSADPARAARSRRAAAVLEACASCRRTTAGWRSGRPGWRWGRRCLKAARPLAVPGRGGSARRPAEVFRPASEPPGRLRSFCQPVARARIAHPASRIDPNPRKPSPPSCRNMPSTTSMPFPAAGSICGRLYWSSSWRSASAVCR